MDSSYMNTGRMNSGSSCSCNQSRRMEDSRRMGNMRWSDESGRMERARRTNEPCRREDSRRMEETRRMDDGRCMGKSEPCEKADGLALAMAYVPWQCYQDTFDLCKGLHMGTIFPELCKPFCGKRGACRC